MPARWRSTCWRSTASPARRRWSRAALDHIRILEDNDFHEFKISVKASDVFLAAAAYQGLAEATDAPIHLGITEAGGLRHRHGQVGDRARQPALDGDRRHDPRQPLGRSGRGGAGRLRDPEGARAAAPRRQHHLLPVLRAAGLRRDQDRRGAGAAAGAHQDADVAVDHRLRGQRAGRGADDRRRLHRRRRGRGHGLSGRQAGPQAGQRPAWSTTSSSWSRSAPPRSRRTRAPRRRAAVQAAE